MGGTGEGREEEFQRTDWDEVEVSVLPWVAGGVARLEATASKEDEESFGLR